MNTKEIDLFERIFDLQSSHLYNTLSEDAKKRFADWFVTFNHYDALDNETTAEAELEALLTTFSAMTAEWRSSEFDEADYNIPSFVLTSGWSDSSWHNDVCPSFRNQSLRVCLWIGQANKKDECLTVYLLQRLNEEGEIEHTEDGDEDLLLTDSLTEVIEYLNTQTPIDSTPAPKQPKTFLWKSTDGRGEPSSTHTEEQIKQNWSLTDEDADGQTLEEFLELSENGDKWINGTEILENIS